MAEGDHVVSSDGSQRLKMELEAVLDRIAGLLRILAEEIVVFDYLNEKYRQEDPGLESF